MSKEFLLLNFLNSEDEQFHLAQTTIISANDLQNHHHDYAEIFFVKEGDGLHLINGKKISITEGTLVIIRPEDKHTFAIRKAGNRMVITNLAFSKANMEVYRTRYSIYARTFFPPLNEAPFTVQLTPFLQNMFSSKIDQMFEEPRDIIHLDMLVLFIFHALHEHVSINQLMPYWLSQALERYTSPFYFSQGIPGFVELTGKSTDHVNRVLHAFMNKSLTETVNKARLKYAANQLIMTNSPIKRITGECGYISINYFHRIFKKYFGVTPGEYRNKNIKII